MALSISATQSGIVETKIHVEGSISPDVLFNALKDAGVEKVVNTQKGEFVVHSREENAPKVLGILHEVCKQLNGTFACIPLHEARIKHEFGPDQTGC